jgi:hypothetical protein
MAMTDEGLTIEEGCERKRRKIAVTESGLWAFGWHDGVCGLAPDPMWADEEEYRRGLSAAHRRMASVAEGEALVEGTKNVWLWGRQ